MSSRLPVLKFIKVWIKKRKDNRLKDGSRTTSYTLEWLNSGDGASSPSASMHPPPTPARPPPTWRRNSTPPTGGRASTRSPGTTSRRSTWTPTQSPEAASLITRRLRDLLGSVWSDRWLKAPARKCGPPPARRRLPGNHSSVHRILEGHRNQQKGVQQPER